MLTPQVTSGKKLSQCRERVFQLERVQFTSENVLKRCSMLQSYLVSLKDCYCCSCQNLANLTCVVCGVQTSKITILFYINKMTYIITYI